jgi:hypothetical protein
VVGLAHVTKQLLGCCGELLLRHSSDPHLKCFKFLLDGNNRHGCQAPVTVTGRPTRLPPDQLAHLHVAPS